VLKAGKISCKIEYVRHVSETLNFLKRRNHCILHKSKSLAVKLQECSIKNLSVVTAET